MRFRPLPLLANLLTVGFALDAGLSLIEEVLRFATGSTALALPRNILAELVWSASILSIPLIVLVRRLPTGPLTVIAVSLFWLNRSMVPVPLLIESPVARGFISVATQVVIAAGLFAWVRRRSEGRHWLWTDEALTGPWFSFRHSAVALGGVTLAAAFTIVVYGPLYLMTEIEASTNGFVGFDLEGVSLADRRYQRDDREVRLVGMMHIGENESYGRLVRTFSEEGTIVLAEGVTDDGLLMKNHLSYDNVAAALGLEQQGHLEDYLETRPGEPRPEWPVIQRADLDMGDFAPETREVLDRVAAALESERVIPAMQAVIEDYADRPEVSETVENDIIHLRNEHLLDEMEVALDDYDRVVVPWGALHLPYIEAALLEVGFEPTTTKRHHLISWSSLIAAAAAML
jgi:hypothetical protein